MSSASTNCLKLAITPGDPAGSGLDITVQQLQNACQHQRIIITDKNELASRAKQLNLALTATEYNPAQPAMPQSEAECKVLHIPLCETVTPGQLNKANATFVLQTLDNAVTGCMSRQFDAMITGPVHKGIINQAGFTFTGHTEYLAEHSRTDKVVMMLCESNTAYNLRVALVTTHLPLAKVSQAITAETLEQTLLILHHELKQYFHSIDPHILVCGLNPHAGENGYLGNEEQDIIIPVIKKLQQQGMHLTGPLSADTLFIDERLHDCDAVLAMYHDQGLPVLKHLGFGQAINITLGLPFIRTSVDHGTALELAATGKTNPHSLQNAIDMAIEMVSSQPPQQDNTRAGK